MKQQLYIVWSAGNELGVPIIDEQHRGIVSIINSFYHCVQEGHEDEIIGPTLSMLLSYAKIHFLTEQRLMTEAAYADLEAHTLLHTRLIQQTRRIAEESPQDRDVDEVLPFLKAWWLGHINKEDRKYAPHVRKLMEAG